MTAEYTTYLIEIRSLFVGRILKIPRRIPVSLQPELAGKFEPLFGFELRWLRPVLPRPGGSSAPPSEGEGRRFESFRVRQIYATVDCFYYHLYVDRIFYPRPYPHPTPNPIFQIIDPGTSADQRLVRRWCSPLSRITEVADYLASIPGNPGF